MSRKGGETWGTPKVGTRKELGSGIAGSSQALIPALSAGEGNESYPRSALG